MISIMLVVIVRGVDHNLLKGVKQQKAQLNTELGVATTERQVKQAQKRNQQTHYKYVQKRGGETLDNRERIALITRRGWSVFSLRVERIPMIKGGINALPSRKRNFFDLTRIEEVLTNRVNLNSNIQVFPYPVSCECGCMRSERKHKTSQSLPESQNTQLPIAWNTS